LRLGLALDPIAVAIEPRLRIGALDLDRRQRIAKRPFAVLCVTDRSVELRCRRRVVEIGSLDQGNATRGDGRLKRSTGVDELSFERVAPIAQGLDLSLDSRRAAATSLFENAHAGLAIS
jgi:hypothetical protein